ncbi:MAG: HIRAN domain-containing protein [Pseudomonadota bacterium]
MRFVIQVGRIARWMVVSILLSLPATAEVSEHILLQASPLAGFQYYRGKQVWAEMHEGDALELVREPQNIHDPRAVRVEWHGIKLGYVPRRDNEAVARLLDRGSRLEARIVRLSASRNPWQRVLFEVYLPLH